MRRHFVPSAIGALAVVLAISLLTAPFPHLRDIAVRVAGDIDRPDQVAPHSTGPSQDRPVDVLLPASWSNPCGLEQHALPARHIIWIWFENQDPKHALGGTATGALAGNCGSTADYVGLTHPSLPNYLAAVSGSTHGLRKDCVCTVTGPSLMSQVSSWRLYAQNMPRDCDPTDHLPYEAHHNVARHFATIDCAAYDVPLTRLRPDLAAGHLPEFSFILPDACHNMHFAKTGCHGRLPRRLAIRTGNTWLRGLLGPILRSPTYRSGHTVIFITWDEGEPVTHTGENCLQTLSEDCKTAVIVVAPSVVPGTVAPNLYDAYSLLRTTETLLHVPLLGGARSAHGMRAAFNL